MGLTVALALFVTPMIGLAIEWAHDDLAVAQAREAAWQEKVAERMKADGWTRVASPAATRLEAHGVELMRAGRDFKLNLLDGPVRGKTPARKRADDAGIILAQELSRLPKSFVNATRLRRVLMCENLNEKGLSIPSLPNYEQTLLLDVNAPPAFLRRLIHHELFHFADFADDRRVLQDDAWQSLNDKYFVYGEGGRNMRAPGSAAFSFDIAGFPSRYATAAVEEDKAEVFAFLMMRPDDMRVLAAKDRVVARKVKAIRAQLHALSPTMNDGFWKGVAGPDAR